MTKSSGDKHTETAEPHWIEWVTGGICTLLVTALIGWLCVDIYRYEPQEAAFGIDVADITPAPGGYRVTFDIRNTSLTTAAAVHVRGDLAVAPDIRESADVTFDYVASESRETGTLFFRADPATGALDLRVMGYTDP